MKIYATTTTSTHDSKLQQSKVVYHGKASCSTVVVSSSAPGSSGRQPVHPQSTPVQSHPQCWTYRLAAACCVFAIFASVGLFMLLYSATQDNFDECEVALPNTSEDLDHESYKEHMTADEETKLETFDVPPLNARHPATILYDFYNEITVYLDRAEDICFVMALNVTHVLRPKSLLEAFVRFKRGDFQFPMDTIRETMRVLTPPIADITPLGAGAAVLCHDLPAYWLVKTHKQDLRKRSIGLDQYHVTYFNGLNMVDLTVAF